MTAKLITKTFVVQNHKNNQMQGGSQYQITWGNFSKPQNPFHWRFPISLLDCVVSHWDWHEYTTQFENSWSLWNILWYFHSTRSILKRKQKKKKIPTYIKDWNFPNINLLVKFYSLEELKLKVKMLATQLYLTLCNPMDCSRQAPLSIAFSRQEYWSGLPCPPPGIFLTQGSSPRPLCLLHWQVAT